MATRSPRIAPKMKSASKPMTPTFCRPWLSRLGDITLPPAKPCSLRARRPSATLPNRLQNSSRKLVKTVSGRQRTICCTKASSVMHRGLLSPSSPSDASPVGSPSAASKTRQILPALRSSRPNSWAILRKPRQFRTGPSARVSHTVFTTERMDAWRPRISLTKRYKEKCGAVAVSTVSNMWRKSTAPLMSDKSLYNNLPSKFETPTALTN
mmetsp:Transcript_112513/g.317785  ORF Transcript_112513/g.317785 Transcript_112513/m.317785 type:complete len:210 (-) Transcript_112513:132-761(-)